MLKRLQYKRDEDIIQLDQFTQWRLKPIQCVQFNEEFYAQEMDNKGLIARRKFKKWVVDILITVQVYKMSEKLKRNYNSKVKLSRMLKFGDKNSDNEDDSDSDCFDDRSGRDDLPSARSRGLDNKSASSKPMGLIRRRTDGNQSLGNESIQQYNNANNNSTNKAPTVF